MPTSVIAVIGYSNTAYRTALRLATAGAPVRFVLAKADTRQLGSLPAAIEVVFRPFLQPEQLPALDDCRAVVVATEDEQFNLHVMMHLHAQYAHLRIVTRLFNLALGREIESRFTRVTVLSVSERAAPFFAAAAFAEHVIEAWRTPDGLMARIGDPQNAKVLRLMDTHERGRLPRPRPSLKLLHRKIQADRLLLTVLGLLLGVIALGTVFFWQRHGLPPGDALYFVVTTLTTTGYGDYSLKDFPFSTKLAGMLLMLSGAGLFTILYAILTDKLFRVRLEVLLGRQRVRKAGHIIVCGAGDVGMRLIECLQLAGADLVVIERNQTGRFNQRIRELGLPMLIADATLADTLERAGIAGAHTIYCATSYDMINLETALNAQNLNPRIRCIVRVFDRDFAEQMRAAFGLDAVLSSSAIASQAFAAAALET